jgi:hypothetical protein
VQYKMPLTWPRERSYAARPGAGVTSLGGNPRQNKQAIFRPILAAAAAGVSAVQPQTPGEHILQPEWPADKVERRAVAALIPYARNARTHSPEQVDQIAASIREWGWTVPVLVDDEGGIIAGDYPLDPCTRILSGRHL